MISFVIPAYNEEALLPACIASIHAEAAGSNYEIIVVDNGSTDSTARVAHELGAIVVTEPRKGITRARQAGLEAAWYDLVAFIDADNAIPKGWLDYVLAAFNELNVVAVSGPVVYEELGLFKRMVGFFFYLLARVTHMLAPMLQGGNFVVCKTDLINAGGFNTDIEFYGEDTSTAVRLSKTGVIKFDLNMWIASSARRMQSEGLFVVGARYMMNYFWIWAVGRPWTVGYRDHRPK